MNNRKLWFGLAALAAAWCFDFLFWQQQGGISFFIWTTVLLVFGYILAWHEKKKPSAWSILLTALILGMSFISAWRSEGFTRFSSMLVTVGGLVLLVTTFLNGHWLYFRVVDYITEFSRTIWAGISGGFKLLFGQQFQTPPPVDGEPRKALRKTGSIVLGLVIALPIVLILGLMLSSADPIFGDLLKKLFSFENLPEYIFRFLYVVVIAFVLVGLWMHAIHPERNADRPETQKAWMQPFLGWTEGGIVLGAVNLLFITFVVIQIRYLFGGDANINLAGYTYSEYARKGFGELVGVAVLSLGLYLVLSTITKRETRGSQIAFSVLAVLLMANVLVILASSLQRLMLYESAYGFSELRTYTHVFIFWLAGLILTAIVLELIKRRGHFALALLVFVVGFTATLGIMNVDGYIVRQNVQSAQAGKELDGNYINGLSSDAVPALVDEFLKPGQPKGIKDVLGAELACRAAILKNEAKTDWRSYRLGEAQASQLLLQNQNAWSGYVVKDDPQDGLLVQTAAGVHSCYWYPEGMD